MLLCFICLFLFWLTPAIWSNLVIEPIFSDKRFPPIDKLHATCTQTANVHLRSDLDIVDVSVLLQFDPQKISISRVLQETKYTDSLIDSHVKYGEIFYRHKDMEADSSKQKKLFSLIFQSHNNVDVADFVFASWSYAITRSGDFVDLTSNTSLFFAPVPECDPDIIPPYVTLVKPFPSASGIALDSLFVFEIKDLGKWVDRSSVYILINEDPYTISSEGVAFSGDYLVVQPKNWLPVGSEVIVDVIVSDLQIFGWPNKTEKTFIFKTANAVILDTDINPMELKKMLYELRQIQWSIQECELIKWLYWFIGVSHTYLLDSMFDKLECNLILALSSELSLSEFSHNAPSLFVVEKEKDFSLFTIIWWLLFFVVLLLKIHYYAIYRKHKKNINIRKS
jgi:hypothetical protein